MLAGAPVSFLLSSQVIFTGEQPLLADSMTIYSTPSDEQGSLPSAHASSEVLDSSQQESVITCLFVCQSLCWSVSLSESNSSLSISISVSVTYYTCLMQVLISTIGNEFDFLNSYQYGDEEAEEDEEEDEMRKGPYSRPRSRAYR